MNKILDIDVSYFSKYYDTNGYYHFILKDGEHYKLLTWLSSILDDGSNIIDAGTHHGHSALALAQNKNVNVVSYDIDAKPIPFASDYPNTKFLIKDVLTLSSDEILQSSLILLDIDPHDGIKERQFFDNLVDVGFKGILVLDDIYLNDSMKKFWEYVNTMKLTIDCTEFGHMTGTGIVIFDSKHLFDLVELI